MRVHDDSPITKARPTTEPDFTPLFSQGDPLEHGWRMLGSGSVTEESPGVLVTRGGPGLLCYAEHRFRDFILRLDYVTSAPEDHSGIYFGIERLPITPQAANEEALEVHIGDAGRGAFRTGSIWNRKASDPVPRMRGPGKWNSLELSVKGDYQEVCINGDVVTIFTTPPKAAGFIGLRTMRRDDGSDRDSVVRFRNLRIKPLAGVPAGGPGAGSAKSNASPEYMTTKGASIKLKYIPAGTFLMGAPEKDSDAKSCEKPQHTVRISRPFYLGVYEVTQAQYRQVTRRNPSWFSSTGGGKELVSRLSTEEHPVENVSWLDAVKFCNAVSQQEGLKPFYRIAGERVTVADWDGPGYRLPTEAEWEYACRAGTRTRWSFGDDYGDPTWQNHGWMAANSGRERWDADRYHDSVKGDWQKFVQEATRRGCRTHPVGGRRPNDYGLFDMHGNVREWCWDWFGEEYYQRGEQTDPTGPEAGKTRVFRDGHSGATPWSARSVCRPDYEMAPTIAHRDTGIRLARTCP